MANDLKEGAIAKPKPRRKSHQSFYPLTELPRTEAELAELKARRDKALDASFGILRGKEILPDELS